MNEIRQREKRIARIDRDLEVYKSAIQKIETTMRKLEWERNHLQAEIEAIQQQIEMAEADVIY